MEVALDLGREAPAADRLRALTGAGTMAWYQADVVQAMHWDEQALALAREIGDRKAEAFTLNNLGAQALELGDYDQAIASFEASLALARAIDEPELMVMPLHNLGLVTWLRGEPAAATDRFAEALALAREHGVAWAVPTILIGFGMRRWTWATHPGGSAVPGESRARARPREPAGRHRRPGGTWQVGAVTGQTRQAARLFGAAAALRDEIAMPHTPSELAYVAPVLTSLQEALGARSLCRRLGGWASRCRSRRRSRRRWPSAPSRRDVSAPGGASLAAAHGLTARELEVLRLLAAGQTNREVGELLFISPATVARHVANIYTQAGCRLAGAGGHASPSSTASSSAAVHQAPVLLRFLLHSLPKIHMPSTYAISIRWRMRARLPLAMLGAWGCRG